MVIKINNIQTCVWHGTVKTSQPLTINEDVIYNSGNIEETETDYHDDYQDLDLDSYNGNMYKYALLEILKLIESKDVETINKTKEIIEKAFNTKPNDYVYIKSYDLEEGEFYREDFDSEFKYDFCEREEATHTLIEFKGNEIVMPGKVDGDNVKFLKINLNGEQICN